MDELNGNEFQPQDQQQPAQNPYEQQPYQQPYQQPNYQQQPTYQQQPDYQQQPYSAQPYQQQPQYNYYQQPIQPKKQGMAIASLVLGIISALCSCAFYFSLPLGSVGLILGIISKKKKEDGKGFSTAGIICSSLGIAIGIIFLIIIILGFTSDSEFSRIFKEAYDSAYQSSYTN